MAGRKWTVVNSCVRGAIHIRNDMPCQDAIRIAKTKHCHIVCLSDGHGSSSCPYSDEGAQAAVDTACAVFASIFKGKNDFFNTISTNKDIWLPKQIEQNWKSAVAAIHKEKERDFPDEGEPFPYELYGATLLTLVVTDDFIFALQLGDGDIMSVEPAEDEELRIDWVIAPDGQLGPETNSLCQDDCWQHMKTRIVPLTPNEAGPMIMLSTDGYANSFFSDEGFKQAGADFFGMLQDEGCEYIKDNLEDWLKESSAQGSGDDIALALVFG